MKMNQMILLGASLVIGGLATATGARADGLSFYGGLHGGTISKYTAPSATDPVKGGMLGVNYGYQAGVSFEAGPIWTGAMYSASNTWSGDYNSSATPRPEVRYLSSTLVLPLMYRIAKGPGAVGVGVYYAHPLTDQSDRNSGLMLSANVPLKGKIYAGVNVLGGFRDIPSGGQPIQTCVSIGMNLK